MRMGIITVVLIAGAPLVGCSLQPVEPWQRATLARDEMQLVPDRIESGFDEQIYFSREAAFGGRGVGGGGCGCN